MSRFRVSYTDAADEFSRKFPDKSLTSYQQYCAPVEILCPKHGIVRFSSYDAALGSKYGCPDCAKQARSTPVKVLDTHTGTETTYVSARQAAIATDVPPSTVFLYLTDPARVGKLINKRYKLLPTNDD